MCLRICVDVTLNPVQVRPGEPVYAQVNRDKKRSRGPGDSNPDHSDYSDHAHHWTVQDGAGHTLDQGGAQPAAGDSWV